MSVTIKDKELRRALAIEGETIEGHARQIFRIQEHFRHTIAPLAQPTEGTCVTYAFGLLESHRQLIAELQALDIRAGLYFMNWLIDRCKLTEVKEPAPGDLVLYFSEGDWRHAGIVIAGGRVASKWGNYGVYDHEIGEVPTAYGDSAQFFAMPSARDAAALLFAFASSELSLSALEAERLRGIVGLER